MNWKVKLVLLFSKLRKPIDGDGTDIDELRKKSVGASRLGSLLFDKKLPVQEVIDTNVAHVPLRIYRPSEAVGLPVVIYYHGGGFVLYGLDSHDQVCRRICHMNNCVVVAVEYRLAPEHTYPAAHEDAYTALNWVRGFVAEYGGNPDKIVVAGDSAGGNLAACMAHLCRDKGIALSGQLLIYPWIDGKLSNPSITRNGKGYLLTKETMFWFQRQYTPRVEDRCVPDVSPCYRDNMMGLAPAFILTAQFDPLLDDGYLYAQQLKAAGNRVRYQEYEGLFHGFFNLPYVHKHAMQAYIDSQAFLKECFESK